MSRDPPHTRFILTEKPTRHSQQYYPFEERMNAYIHAYFANLLAKKSAHQTQSRPPSGPKQKGGASAPGTVQADEEGTPN